MVTGDRYATAKAVAEEVGIASSEVLSEILPKDKIPDDLYLDLDENYYLFGPEFFLGTTIKVIGYMDLLQCYV